MIFTKAVFTEGVSIYLQISQWVEDDILTGIIKEEELIPSTNQFAKHYSINPATAAKGINLLVDEDIICKKRGIGMCVKTGARDIILQKRKNEFCEKYINELINEATKLKISKNELIKIIERYGERDEK